MHTAVLDHSEDLVTQKAVRRPRIHTAFTLDFPSNRYRFKPLLRFRCLLSRP